jgi:septation ring formation regulator EzrA
MPPQNVENEVKMAKFETDLENIKELLLDIKSELRNGVPRSELQEMFRSRDEQIREVKSRQDSNKHMVPTWISITIALAALIYSFIK